MNTHREEMMSNEKVQQIRRPIPQRNHVEEVKAVLAIVQKEEKKTTHRPYRNPNYNFYFDQRQGQNEHSQNSYVDKQTVQHTKQ